MKRLIRFAVTFLITIAIPSSSIPAAMAAPQDDGVIRIGGSTTLLPVIATAASQFMARFKTWDKVDPALSKKDIVIYVTGGGSGFGVQATIQGTVHIGLVARELKDKERELLGAHQAVIIGKDAVAIAVNKGNPLARKIKTLSREQIADIFSGKIATYQQIDPSLKSGKIVLLVRDPGAGSAEIIQEMVMREKQVSREALQLPSQGALLKKLETNKLALAYISAGLLAGSDKLQGFAFEGVPPTTAKILSGDYPLIRPLYMVLKEPQDPLVRHFVEYMLADGQKIVQEDNYIPVKDDTVKPSGKKGNVGRDRDSKKS